ncbi:M23 family metallopeptidase [uncultured Subdoligranulum sp.]|uniref:M23 family metallopeptidase n=1 Tax=uncultured Subdoligranulum sp. TaxID=512298 RepID=UPI0025FEE730|nr:peptidoglycan DD-metalloendopeptidase family protein [uncultured Subdoligranulum sp.]
MEEKKDQERVIPQSEQPEASALAPQQGQEGGRPSGGPGKNSRRRRRRKAKSGAGQGPSVAPGPEKAGDAQPPAPAEKPAGKRVRPVRPADEKPNRPPESPAEPEKTEQTPAGAAEPTGRPEPAPGEETAPAAEGPKAAPDMPDPPEPAEATQPAPPQTPEQTEKPEDAPAGTEETTGQPENAPEEKPDPAEPEPEEPAGTPEPEEEPESEEEPEETPEQLRRTAELTRTVQLSIEKLTDVPDPMEAVEPAAAPTLADRMREGLWRVLRWLLLVAAFVALVAGVGIAWLYSGASDEAIPEVSASFNGQTLETASSSWHVPVVANFFKRTYSEKNFTEPEQLDDLETTRAVLRVQADGCDTELEITDEADQTVFEGTAEEFESFRFSQNGSYTGRLRVYRDNDSLDHEAGVSGQQIYLFTFQVRLKPGIRLNTTTVQQGGVAALRVSGILDTETPTLDTDLTNTGFYEGESGWIVYLPIEYDREPGDYTLTVTAGGYTEELTLTVSQRTEQARDVSSRSQLTSPYLGLEDTPAEVQALLNTGAAEAAWAEEGFVQPFTDSIEISLAYGTTEYVGRTRTQRQAGTGSGRTSTNIVVTGRRGGQLIAPADGQVLLAEDLGGTAGNTIVIDHGAGVKSIFYNLRELSVQKGQTVIRGQQIATTNQATIGEVRIVDVPVEPLSIWRGQCDALRYY